MRSKKRRHIKNKIEPGKLQKVKETASEVYKGKNTSGISRFSKVIISVILLSAFAVRAVRIGEHAFVFDEAIYVKIVKDIVVNGYDWQSMRMLGTAHPPVYFILMSFLYKYFYFMN